jgi:hypothetical protein
MSVNSLVNALRSSRKVADSISGGVIEIFLWLKPFGRTMALEPTQPLEKMSTRILLGGGGGGGGGA